MGTELIIRADSLREYLTGASSDGGSQSNPAASFGHYRSSTEAVSLGILIESAISGAVILYAGGGNPVGSGTLTAIDGNNLTWQPYGAAYPGPATYFSGTITQPVEALEAPGEFLRIEGTPPFSPGASEITLALLPDNFFGYDDVSISNASAGISEYRATIIRNESGSPINSLQRWLALLGTSQTSNTGQLGASGAGIIQTSGSFSTWPLSGWAQVRSSGGTLKEVVYYTSRTATQLTVPAAGRALLGSSATAGASADVVSPVPGVGFGFDPAGPQSLGSSIQTIAGATTSPSGVSWNFGISLAEASSPVNLGVGQQIGFWTWRQIPAGAIATPQAVTRFMEQFYGGS